MAQSHRKDKFDQTIAHAPLCDALQTVASQADTRMARLNFTMDCYVALMTNLATAKNDKVPHVKPILSKWLK